MKDPSLAERRYQIRGVIGIGGFGKVYLARRLDTSEALVALKMPSADAGPEEIAQLRREATILGLIRHPGIVAAEGVRQLSGRWCLVMEYIDGLSLDALVGRGGLPEKAIAQLASQVAHALFSAQQARDSEGRPLGLQHRDIKPSNLLLTPKGRVKLLDFGIAHPLGGSESPAVGSLGYIAPERLAGEEHPRSDQYGLGVSLWEFLTGNTFGKTLRDPARHQERRASALMELRVRGVHEGLAELVCALLHFSPSERPSASECVAMADGIARALEGTDLRTFAAQTVAPTTFEPAEDDALPIGTILVENETKEPAKRRRPGLATLLFVAAVAALSIATLRATDNAPQKRHEGRSTTRVYVTGDRNAVELRGATMTFPLPGPVPAGSYRIYADFEGLEGTLPAGELLVEENEEEVFLHCNVVLGRCERRIP